MDDIQIILYIIIGIFYFISRLGKKKPVPQKPVSKDGTSPSGEKPLTFEELLKEFTQQNQPQEKRIEVEEVEEDIFVDTRDEGRKNAEPVYKPDYSFSDAESKRIFEESQRLAEASKRIEEGGLYQDVAFKPYRIERKAEEKNEVAAGIMDLLKDGDGAKKAVILAEIFNRRY